MRFALEFKDVSIEKMIADQKDKLKCLLDDIIDKLVQEEIEHKERFKMDKLQVVFPQALYFTGKVCEGSRKNDEAWRWRRNADLEEVKNILSRFKSRLEERGLSVNTYDSIKYLYESLEYPISELDICFKRSQEGQEANINSQTAYIFHLL